MWPPTICLINLQQARSLLHPTLLLEQQQSLNMVHSSLNVKRGSEWMGLPSELSPETIDIIVATAPVVAPKVGTS